MRITARTSSIQLLQSPYLQQAYDRQVYAQSLRKPSAGFGGKASAATPRYRHLRLQI
jgi:hypothetical protein